MRSKNRIAAYLNPSPDPHGSPCIARWPKSSAHCIHPLSLRARLSSAEPRSCVPRRSTYMWAYQSSTQVGMCLTACNFIPIYTDQHNGLEHTLSVSSYPATHYSWANFLSLCDHAVRFTHSLALLSVTFPCRGDQAHDVSWHYNGRGVAAALAVAIHRRLIPLRMAGIVDCASHFEILNVAERVDQLPLSVSRFDVFWCCRCLVDALHRRQSTFLARRR